MPRESSSKGYAERKWYCHACGDGPLSCRFDDWCPMCSHGCCRDCEKVVITYSNR